MENMLLEKGVVADVKAIHHLLLGSAKDGLLLPRPLSNLYKHIRDFYVIRGEDSGQIYGCCALAMIWEDLAEIRSLVITEELRGKNFGRMLVEACINEARAMGLHQVFTLTYQDAFFEKLGFTVVGKETLPNKIWTDCVHCPKFPDCDEIAMLLELKND